MVTAYDDSYDKILHGELIFKILKPSAVKIFYVTKIFT